MNKVVKMYLSVEAVSQKSLLPITLGRGKRLFAEGALPAGFDLTGSGISSKGVIVADYVRAGGVKTGSFGQEVPSAVELSRREKLRKEAA